MPSIYFSKRDWSVTNSVRDAFLILPDGDYKITIEKVKHIRSPEQNARYWVILQVLDTYATTWVNELHEHFKKEFLKARYIRSTVDKRRKRKLKPTTTKLSTEEFMIFNEKVMEFWKRFFGIDWSKHWF